MAQTDDFKLQVSKCPSVLTIHSIVAVGPLGPQFDSFVNHVLERMSRTMINLAEDIKLISMSNLYPDVADIHVL